MSKDAITYCLFDKVGQDSSPISEFCTLKSLCGDGEFHVLLSLLWWCYIEGMDAPAGIWVTGRQHRPEFIFHSGSCEKGFPFAAITLLKLYDAITQLKWKLPPPWLNSLLHTYTIIREHQWVILSIGRIWSEPCAKKTSQRTRFCCLWGLL